MRPHGIRTVVVPVLLVLASAAGRLVAQADLGDHPRVREAIHLLDVWIDAQVAYEQIPGASVAVVKDQALVWSEGYGLANREEGIPTTPQTIYSICSISKLFTSVALMRLRDEGRLRLTDPVSEHLTWFTELDQTFPEAGPVKVEGLLTHSSGLPRESAHPYWSAPDFDFPAREEIIEELSTQEMLYPTYTYYQYSNLGLTLAGEIVAAVSGMPYDRYVRSSILDPLGLDDTTPEIPAELWGGRMAVGYSAVNRDGSREPMPMFQARGIAPAAGFASTVEDLAAFASWQFRVLSTHGDEVLDANTLREMQRVHWLDRDWDTARGLGFGVWRWGDENFTGHGGSCPGYRSHLALQTDDRVATVFAANALGVSPSLYTRRAYEIMAPALEAAGDEEAPADRDGPPLDPYLGTYANSFGGETAVLPWKGDLVMAYLPTENPLGAMTELRHVVGHTFRRVRDDGALGETVTFEVEDGRAVRFVRFSNVYPRVQR